MTQLHHSPPRSYLEHYPYAHDLIAEVFDHINEVPIDHGYITDMDALDRLSNYLLVHGPEDDFFHEGCTELRENGNVIDLDGLAQTLDEFTKAELDRD